MGHERVGFLPKTKKWIDLVGRMGSLYSSELPVTSIAAQTLQNVRKQYETLSNDDTVKSIFEFLVTFARSCQAPSPQAQLNSYNISLPDNPTLLSLVKAMRDKMPSDKVTSEYGQLAVAAAADALGQWHKEHATGQLHLFQPKADFFETWRDVGNGSGFCELSRLYFGKLTERYLNYFLDRAASNTFTNITERERFHRDVSASIEDVSKHAFETAKITQSFAAGWFNKNTREGLPDSRQIEGFLSIAFGKLREELRREGDAK